MAPSFFSFFLCFQKGVSKMILYWDFDGTLVHSESLWSTSVYRALREVVPDTPVTLADIRPYMAYGFPWHTPITMHAHLTGSRWWKHMNAHFFQTYLSLGIAPDYAKAASILVREILLLKENYTLYPDCLSTLQDSMEKGFHNVLLSNNHPDLRQLMDQLGLSKYFEHFIISGEVGYDKPDPAIFALAKSFYSPDDTHVMIGDSISADILGGNAAGMRTILVHSPPADVADVSILNLADLFSALVTLDTSLCTI